MKNKTNKLIPTLLLASSLLFTNCEIKKVYEQGRVIDLNPFNYEIIIKDSYNQDLKIKLKGNKKSLDKLLKSDKGIKIGDRLEFPIAQIEKPIISQVSVYNPYIRDNVLKLKYNQIKTLK
jgi:hypothetical protein